MFKRYGIATLVIALAVFFVVQRVQATSSDNVNGYAWSSNIGWIHMNGADYGVNVSSSGAVDGYAWSSNIGWISFNSSDLSGCPSGACEARFDQSTGVLSGWAKAIAANQSGSDWDGWIHLYNDPDGDGVVNNDGASGGYGVVATECNWNGYAWASNIIGWVHFSGSGYGVTGTGDACQKSGEPTLSVTPNAVQILKGGTTQYTAWLDPDGEEGSKQKVELTSGVIWATSNPLIATIEGSGKGTATGVNAGAVTVTAIYYPNGGGIPDSVQSPVVTLTVVVPIVPKLTLSPTDITIPVGAIQTYTPSYDPDGGVHGDGSQSAYVPNTTAIKWVVSDSSVATVSGSPYGTATALKAGNITVKARWENVMTPAGIMTLESNTVTLHVIQPASPALVIFPIFTVINLTNCSTSWMLARYFPKGLGDQSVYIDPTSGVTWKNSNPVAVSFTGTGSIVNPKGATAGTSHVTATYAGTNSVNMVTINSSITPVLRVNPPNSTISTVHSHYGIKYGDAANYEASIFTNLQAHLDPDGPTCAQLETNVTNSTTWISPNNTVYPSPVISNNSPTKGKITAGATSGSWPFTASIVSGGQVVSASTNVTQARLSIDPNGAKVDIGGSQQLNAVPNPSSVAVDQSSTDWWLSNTSTDIFFDPIIRGLATGVKATSNTEVSVKYPVGGGRYIYGFGTMGVNSTIVTPTVRVVPSSPSIQVGGTVQLTAYYDSDGPSGPIAEVPLSNNSTGAHAEWSDFNAGIATSSKGPASYGLVTGHSSGQARIRASYGGTFGESLVTVTAIPSSVTLEMAQTQAGTYTNCAVAGQACSSSNPILVATGEPQAGKVFIKTTTSGVSSCTISHNTGLPLRRSGGTNLGSGTYSLRASSPKELNSDPLFKINDFRTNGDYQLTLSCISSSTGATITRTGHIRATTTGKVCELKLYSDEERLVAINLSKPLKFTVPLISARILYVEGSGLESGNVTVSADGLSEVSQTSGDTDTVQVKLEADFPTSIGKFTGEVTAPYCKSTDFPYEISEIQGPGEI